MKHSIIKSVFIAAVTISTFFMNRVSSQELSGTDTISVNNVLVRTPQQRYVRISAVGLKLNVNRLYKLSVENADGLSSLLSCIKLYRDGSKKTNCHSQICWDGDYQFPDESVSPYLVNHFQQMLLTVWTYNKRTYTESIDPCVEVKEFVEDGIQGLRFRFKSTIVLKISFIKSVPK